MQRQERTQRFPKKKPYEYPDERKTLCVGTFGAKESFYTMKGIANGIADNELKPPHD